MFLLKFYFVTIIIFAIIILATANLLGSSIKNNGWLNYTDNKFKHMNKQMVLFCVSAIPFFRVLIIIAFFYMAFNKKEE